MSTRTSQILVSITILQAKEAGQFETWLSPAWGREGTSRAWNFILRQKVGKSSKTKDGTRHKDTGINL